jgi:hypothetical protein
MESKTRSNSLISRIFYVEVVPTSADDALAKLRLFVHEVQRCCASHGRANDHGWTVWVNRRSSSVTPIFRRDASR